MVLPEKFNTDIIDAILAAIPDPVFVLDETGRYVEILGGIDRQKYNDGQHLIGKRIHDVMSAEIADNFVVQINKTIEAQEVIREWWSGLHLISPGCTRPSRIRMR